MSEPSEDTSFQVIIALDPECPSAAAVHAAIALATGRLPSLQGVYVEEEDLLRLGRIPGLLEVELTSGLARQLSAELIERSLITRAGLVRSAFLAAAEACGVPHDFTVMRGRLPEELARVSAAAELLVVGLGGRAFGRRHWLHGRIGRLLECRTTSLAIVRERTLPARTIVGLVGATEAMESVTALTTQLARAERLGWLLLSASRDAAAVSTADAALRRRLLRRLNPDEIAETLWLERASSVVLSRSDPALAREFIERLIEAAPCTVVLAT